MASPVASHSFTLGSDAAFTEAGIEAKNTWYAVGQATNIGIMRHCEERSNLLAKHKKNRIKMQVGNFKTIACL